MQDIEDLAASSGEVLDSNTLSLTSPSLKMSEKLRWPSRTEDDFFFPPISNFLHYISAESVPLDATSYHTLYL